MSVRENKIINVKADNNQITTTVEFNNEKYLLVTDYKKNPAVKTDGSTYTFTKQPGDSGPIDPFAFVLHNTKFISESNGTDDLKAYDKEFICNSLLVWAEGNLNNAFNRMLNGLDPTEADPL